MRKSKRVLFCFCLFIIPFVSCHKDWPKKKECKSGLNEYFQFDYQPQCSDVISFKNCDGDSLSYQVCPTETVMEYVVKELANTSTQYSNIYINLGYSSEIIPLNYYNSNEISVNYFDVAGKFEIVITNENDQGCISEKSGFIHIPRSYHCVIPNAFTPNNDGINDYFFAKGIFNQYDFHMQIFRKGKLVFETSSPNNPWSGLNEDGEEMKEGKYRCKVMFQGKNEEVTMCSFVHLYREKSPPCEDDLIFGDMLDALREGVVYETVEPCE